MKLINLKKSTLLILVFLGLTQFSNAMMKDCFTYESDKYSYQICKK